MLKQFNCLLMVVLLTWLTVCTPFVNSVRQQVALEQGITDDNAGNPLANTNEERVENATNTLSEYLHEAHPYYTPSYIIVSEYKCHPDALYSVFHPELVSPPPEAAV